MEMNEITKEQFEAYEKVRASGVTNMWATNVVAEASGCLDEEEVMAIIKNYDALNKKYSDVRKDEKEYKITLNLSCFVTAKNEEIAIETFSDMYSKLPLEDAIIEEVK